MTKEEEADDKVAEFQTKLKVLCEDYGVAIMIGASFKEEKLTGVMSFNTSGMVEDLGLSKMIEQKFNN